MLCRNNYPQKYIDECRKKVEHQIAVYKNLVKAAGDQKATKLSTAIESLETIFFNNMVLALENYFVHRNRAIEQKDGNALNEVRMISNLMMNNNNILTADNTIKYKPENSVVKYQPGDETKLKQEDFVKLSKAFFAEIESKYL